MRFTPALFILSASFAGLVVTSPTNGGGTTSGGGLDVVGCALTLVGCVASVGGDVGPLLGCLKVGLPVEPISDATCVLNAAANMLSQGIDMPSVCTQCMCNIVDVPLGICSSASK